MQCSSSETIPTRSARAATLGPRARDLIALVLVCSLFAAHALAFKVLLDDAFISFRYARNFAEGLGLVYNPGERVEGYTDFSWVFLLGILGRLGIDIPAAGTFLGMLLSLATIVLLRFHPMPARAWPSAPAPPLWLAWLPSLFLAASLPFAFQAGSGLATALFTFLLTLSVYARERWREDRFPREVLPVTLLALTRPEGCLILLVFLVFELADAFVRPRSDARALRSTPWRRATLLAVVFAVLFVPYFVWRWTYYGFLLPNTFYAKVGTTLEQVQRGLQYGWDFLPHVAGPLLLVVILFATFSRARRGQALRITLIAVFGGYVISVGGDHMPVFRFFVPILPVVYLMLRDALLAVFELHGERTTAGGGGQSSGSRRAARRATIRSEVLNPARSGTSMPMVRSIRAAVLIALALSFIETGYFSFRRELGNVFQETLAEKRAQERELRLVGQHFASVSKPGSTLALGITGAIGYYSRLPILDFFGLTDSQIAHRKVGGMGIGAAGHEKGDGYYILSRKPTYIMNTFARLHPAPLDPTNAAVRERLFWSLSERQIASSPAFWNEYRARTIPLAGRYLIYFERVHDEWSDTP